MKSLIAKDQAIQAQFNKSTNWEERYQTLIQLGKNMVGLPDEEKSEDLKVKGCQSQVWIKARLDENGRVRFLGDSDALIVRGLVSLLLNLYDGEEPKNILSYQPEFIEKLELSNHLSPSRANGLFSMLKQIKYYGLAFESLVKK